MKKAIAALASFSRVERLALAVFSALLLILIVIRCSLSIWVRPKEPDAALRARLQTEYLAWQAKEAANPDAGLAAGSTATINAEPFAFDPNTLDSAGFIRLGMPPRAVKGLLRWRKWKRFNKAEDLKPSTLR